MIKGLTVHAQHEAAHAVTAKALHYSVDSVEVIVDYSSGTIIGGKTCWNPDSVGINLVSRIAVQLAPLVLNSPASLAAVSREMGYPPAIPVRDPRVTRSCSDDISKVLCDVHEAIYPKYSSRSLPDFYQSPRNVLTLLAHGMGVACIILVRHWGVVEEIAKAISQGASDSHKVEGDSLACLLESVDWDYPDLGPDALRINPLRPILAQWYAPWTVSMVKKILSDDAISRYRVTKK